MISHNLGHKNTLSFIHATVTLSQSDEIFNSVELSVHRGCPKLSEEEPPRRCTAFLDARSWGLGVIAWRGGSGLEQSQELRISSQIHQFILLLTQYPPTTHITLSRSQCYHNDLQNLPWFGPESLPYLFLLLFLLLFTPLWVHDLCHFLC